MSYKILTKNGIENTNIDGARGENFNAGMRSGIVKGALNEGNFNTNASNSIFLDTCELRISGHRIVIDEIIYKTFTNTPTTPTRYSLVAQVVVNDSSNVDFSMFVQSANTTLVQDNLYKTLNGAGTYQLEIGRFTLQPDGTITDVVRTADLITGGSSASGSGNINIGYVTTNTLDAGMEAEVDIEERVDPEDGKTYIDFNFDIPQGPQGPQGETGATGAQGPQGVSITGVFISEPPIQVDNGNQYTISVNFSDNTTANVGSFIAPKGESGSTILVNGIPQDSFEMDNKQDTIQYVTLTGVLNGTVTDEQLAILTSSKTNCVIHTNQVYRLSDEDANRLVYTCITDAIKRIIKITKSTKTWARYNLDLASANSVSAINEKIPSEASASNQLADKNYVVTIVDDGIDNLNENFGQELNETNIKLANMTKYTHLSSVKTLYSGSPVTQNVTVSLTSVLPDNTTKYLIFIKYNMWSVSTQWEGAETKISTGLGTWNINGARNNQDAANQFMGTTIIPVSSSRSITIYFKNMDIATLEMMGYMRIG